MELQKQKKRHLLAHAAAALDVRMQKASPLGLCAAANAQPVGGGLVRRTRAKSEAAKNKVPILKRRNSITKANEQRCMHHYPVGKPRRPRIKYRQDRLPLEQ